MGNLTSIFYSWERSAKNTFFLELNPLLPINVTMRGIKRKKTYRRVNNTKRTQWKKTENPNVFHIEGDASYAALGSILLGEIAFLVYQAGQLATVAYAELYLNALPYFYEWATRASARSLIKGVVISLAAAAAHHVTLIFGVVLFAGPVLWIAGIDARDERVPSSVRGVLSRAVMFSVLVGA